MTRCFLFFAWAVILIARDARADALKPTMLQHRGVTFYLPFEETTKALVALGRARPWAEKSVEFVTGKFGKALHVSQKEKSILAYEVLGNIPKRRGAIAFWVRTPWRGADRDILTRHSLSGPFIISISAEGVWESFFHLWRRKSFFDCRFGGKALQGPLKMFGTLGTKLVPLWQRNIWQHLVVTWDDRSGFALFFNGKKVYELRAEIKWQMHEPHILAFATMPLREGDLWSVDTDADFDEFIVFNRPLSEAEVQLVMGAKYEALRPITPQDFPFDPQARRRELHLLPIANRPTFRVDDSGHIVASMREIAVEEVDIAFHGRYALVDGNEKTALTFEDGGMLFNRLARFRFAQKATVDHLTVVTDEAKGSYCLDRSGKPLAHLSNGYAHIKIPRKPRSEFRIMFKGGAKVREVRFFDLNAPTVTKGETLFVSQPIERNRWSDSARILLRYPHPDDGPPLLVTWRTPSERRRLIRKALHHTFFVLDAPSKDKFVKALRLVLWLRPKVAKLLTVLRIYDPLIRGRTAFALDASFDFGKADKFVCLDLTAHLPGFVIPAGRRVVIQFTADADYELFFGGSMLSRIEIVEGDRKRIGHEFAQALLRGIWSAYLRRLNQNRFMRQGETEETNPIKRNLEMALKYDSKNALANVWYKWARFRPWEAFDFSYLERQPDPRWAVYGREAIRSVQDIIHWWLDHRSNKNGYLIGYGNEWNDITKLYNKFIFLCGIVDDERLLRALERYLDAHWNTGRMVDGYACFLTDIVHSAEEASFLQPCLQILRPGVPRHFYRDLLTASNLRKWLGENRYGHTHFRSNFFTARRILLGGAHGRDVPLCASVMVPARTILWYNGHPELKRLFSAYVNSWLEDTLRGTNQKPAGAVPAGVQFDTDELFTGYAYKWLIYEQFLAMYQMTGERRFLLPLQKLLEKREQLGDPKWFNYFCLNLLSYRLLTGDSRYDDLLRSLSSKRLELHREDFFFQRGIERSEGEGLLKWVIDRREEDLLESLKYVIRNNRRALPIYGPTDPPTDRVYPWGRVTLPVMMLGGRLFDERACEPFPTAAFLWQGNDGDLVSMVFDVDFEKHRLKMLVHNFKGKPMRVGIRMLSFPEGQYRILMAPDHNSDRRADGNWRSVTAKLYRFRAYPLTFPPGTTLVELQCLVKQPIVARPDLAITLAKQVSNDGIVVARVHNLGTKSAKQVLVWVVDESGRVVGKAILEKIPGLSGFQPQVREVTIKVNDAQLLKKCKLVVDPKDNIAEINEANNTYSIDDRTPPPVEKPSTTKFISFDFIRIFSSAQTVKTRANPHPN